VNSVKSHIAITRISGGKYYVRSVFDELKDNGYPGSHSKHAPALPESLSEFTWQALVEAVKLVSHRKL